MISFSSHACLTPGEQIMEYPLKLFSINCRYWSPDDFLDFIKCTWIAFFMRWLQSFPTDNSHMGLDRANRRVKKDNQFFGPHIRSIRQAINWMLYGQLQHTAGRNNRPSPQHKNFRKIVPESVQFTFPEFIVSGTSLGPIVLVALMAHHTSSLTRINLRLSADHLLLCKLNSGRLNNIVPYLLNKLPRVPRHQIQNRTCAARSASWSFAQL